MNLDRPTLPDVLAQESGGNRTSTRWRRKG